MKNILVSLFLLSLTTFAHASHAYIFTPDVESQAMCARLRMNGEFRLERYSSTSSSWLVIFAAGADRIVDKQGSGVYGSYVSCATGCTGYAEVRLNLNDGTYYYWNSINRPPEVCKGSIQN